MTLKPLAASIFVTFALAVGVTDVHGVTVVGDYNGNGFVDQADLDLVLLNWGQDGSTPPSGWVNQLPSGQIGQEQLDLVLLNWGSTTSASPVFGDFNGNGFVDQADLDLVLLNWGQDGSTPPSGWVNQLPAGQIGQEQLDHVLLNWGSGAQLGASGSFGASGVPEPSAVLLALIALGGACCLLRRSGAQQRLSN